MGYREDLDELTKFGPILDARPERLGGRTVTVFLAESLLELRSRRGPIVPLRLNSAQRAFEERRGSANIVLKARQMGLSTWISARLFLQAITLPGTLNVQVAQTQDAAEAIFQITHRFLGRLPRFLREGALRTSVANAREIRFPLLDSGLRVESAGDPNAGRGLTISNLHCSEVARWAGDARGVLQGLKAALVPGGELTLESTPRGAEGCFWEEWQRADEMGTVKHFFPWWWESSYVTTAAAEEGLSEEERRLRTEHGLSLRQIGYRRKLAAGYGEMAKQEFAEDAESCFAASGCSIFDTAAVDRRLGSIPKPQRVQQNGALLVWLPPVEGRTYLVAVDTAGGGAEGDFAVAQVVEVQTGLQCAELRVKMPVLELAQQVVQLHREYNRAWVVVERNNHGSGVLAHLGGMMDEARIYRSGGKRGAEGWLTSAATRPGMLASFGALLVEKAEIFNSERLLRECRSFVRLSNGRSGAQSGAHDDCVMAMAMAHAVRAELIG